MERSINTIENINFEEELIKNVLEIITFFSVVLYDSRSNKNKKNNRRFEKNSEMNISHKIEIKPNNKSISYFKKAFGCARFAYNWGLAKWKEAHEKGEKKTHLDLKKEFNSLKDKEFPFVYEVSKYVTQQPFINLGKAFKKFFKDLKNKKISYPQFRRKKDNEGSFYIGGDQVKVNGKYLGIPLLKNKIKMTEELRFKGKINSVTISYDGNKYFASFQLEIDNNEYKKTRKVKYNGLAVGGDIGVKAFLTLSNGLQILFPKEKIKKQEKKIIKLQRQLSKKVHPKTKGDKTNKSNNYIKHSKKLNKAYKKLKNIKNDFLHKLTTVLINNFQYIAVEKLNVSGLLKNHKLAKSIQELSFFEFRRQLEYKALFNKREIVKADTFYPSSKTCSRCGKKKDLTLSDRVYECECGLMIDRDYNASINLLNLIKDKVREVLPEFTSVDLTALLDDLSLNCLATSKVEAEI